MTNTNTIAQIDQSLRDLRQLRELLMAAEDYQYTAPKFGTGLVEEGDSSVDYSDPTGDTAVNSTRISLRSKVIKTESDVRMLNRATGMMLGRLHQALRPWTNH